MRWIALAAVVLGLTMTWSGRAWAGSTLWSGESNLTDTEALLSDMRNRGASELPLEALALYRSGRDAVDVGETERGRELFARAAAADPAFPEAHFALARLNLFTRPQSVLGNLWEYCSDPYDSRDPECPALRGGSWKDPAEKLIPTKRLRFLDDWTAEDPNYPPGVWWIPGGDHLGLRVVRSGSSAE